MSIQDSNAYKVSLYSTPMPFPLNFAVHTWFVVEYAGNVDRYEVWATLGRYGDKTVYKNAIEPTAGFRTSFFDSLENPKKVGVSTLLGSTQGESQERAGQMYRCIVDSLHTYPALHTYRMWPGPNSNTYTQWILNQFPDFLCTLEWNAVGKNYPLV